MPLDIPNAFTPNPSFDDVNTTWNILNIELYPEVDVQVYSRNGNMVFQSNGYEQEWDGIADDGETLPAGVYYYFINLNKYGATFKGTISILK